MCENITILTSRFNNKTWEESNRIRNNYIINDEKIKCVYCSTQKIIEKIPLHSFLFIIEMNNDTNTIEGIGFIRNTIQYNKIKVHEEGDFNRYIYTGRYWLSIEILTKENPILMDIFTQLLFRGKTHSKRGRGLLRFPEKLFRHELFNDIGNEMDIKKILFSIFSKNKDKNFNKDK